MFTQLKRMLVPASLVLGLLAVGCVTSKYTLIASEQAKVDRAYVGDFDATNFQGEHTTIIIRNLDDKMYYVETDSANAEKVQRYAGFIARVKDAVFAELRPIADDGSIPDDWTLMRIDLAGKRLTFRPLSESFFKAQKIGSNDELNKFVEQNVDNKDLYDRDGILVGTRL